MNLTKMNVPKPVRSFVKAVTFSPASGFLPIVPCVSVKAQIVNNDYFLDFLLEDDAKINYKMIFAWFPKNAFCKGTGLNDGVFSVTFNFKSVS